MAKYFLDLEFTSDPTLELSEPHSQHVVFEQCFEFEQPFERAPKVFNPITKQYARATEPTIPWKVNGNDMYTVSAQSEDHLKAYLIHYCGGDIKQAEEFHGLICYQD